MKGWQMKPLAELCDIKHGFAFKGEFFTDKGDYVVLTPGNYFEAGGYRDRGEKQKYYAGEIPPDYIMQEGDLLVAMTEQAAGLLGSALLVPESNRFLHNQRLGLVIAKPGVQWSNEFYFHVFNTPSVRKAIHDSASGVKVRHTSPTKIGEVMVPVPPLAEQQRIVGVLDEAMAGIATARAHAETNLQNARALFESHLHAVFTQRGPGWVERTLSDVCSITSSLVDPRKAEFLDLTHVGAGNIESQTGSFVDLKTAREEGLISGKFLFDESMVLYSKIRPYLMKVARPDFAGLCSADMYPLAPATKAITRDFLFHLLLSKDFTDYAVQGSARAGMPKVNREHLFAYRFLLPDLKTQQRIADQLDALSAETQRLAALYERKLAALEELKKSLLHQAFRGNL